MSVAFSLFLTSLFFMCLGQGTAQHVPCFNDVECQSENDIGITASVSDCCVKPNSHSYRPSLGSEVCYPCYAFGWVMNISKNYTRAKAQSDIIAEEGQSVTLTLFFLKNNPRNILSHHFNIETSGSATEGEDYILSYTYPLFLQVDPVYVNVSLLNDRVTGENNERITLTLVQNTTFFPFEEDMLLANPNVTITIQNTPDIVLERGIISEEDDSYDVCLNIMQDSEKTCLLTNPIILTAISVNGTASAGEDFEEVFKTLTIPPCARKYCFNISIINDNIMEQKQEDFRIVLIDDDGSIVAERTYYIYDTDEIQIGFTDQLYFARENDTVVNVCIHMYLNRDFPAIASFPIDIQVSTRGRTAVAGKDYVGLDDFVVSFPPGESLTCFKVIILHNCVRDRNVLKRFVLYIDSSPLPPRAKIDLGETYFIIQDIDIYCPRLNSPAFGSVVWSGLQLYDTANYSCSPGFELVGASQQLCEGVEWNYTPPECIPVCPALTDPEHGTVSVSGHRVGDMATYSCNGGYQLIGENSLTCENSGRWNVKPPICRPECPLLRPPTNGTVKNVSGLEQNLAVYSCDAGFGLVGDPMLTCLPSGSWNKEPPQCKMVCEVCPVVQCDSCCPPIICPPPTPCPSCPTIVVPTTVPPQTTSIDDVVSQSCPTVVAPTTVPPQATSVVSQTTMATTPLPEATPTTTASSPTAPPSPSTQPPSTEPPPTAPPSKPGIIENVTRPYCGLLRWNPQPGNVTYRLRFYTGQNFGQTPGRQRKIISSQTNSLNFTANDIPPGRPMFVVVKARNSNGGFSRKWSLPMLAAVTGCP